MSRLARILVMMVLGTSAAGVMATAAVVIQPQRHQASAACVNREGREANAFEVQFCGGAENTYSCNPGNHGDFSEPLFALNGCSVGVKLYPLNGEVGSPTLCVGPNSSTGALFSDWQSFKVGAC
jgi:hypothetical protein